MQLLIGLIIFRLPVSHRILLWLNDAVLVLLNASKSGSVFLFGPLAASPGESGSVGFILVFQVLPVVIFFAAFTAMLYHLRVLQVFVRLFARLFHRTMKISGAESLSSAANIFVDRANTGPRAAWNHRCMPDVTSRHALQHVPGTSLLPLRPGAGLCPG